MLQLLYAFFLEVRLVATICWGCVWSNSSAAALIEQTLTRVRHEQISLLPAHVLFKYLVCSHHTRIPTSVQYSDIGVFFFVSLRVQYGSTNILTILSEPVTSLARL